MFSAGWNDRVHTPLQLARCSGDRDTQAGANVEVFSHQRHARASRAEASSRRHARHCRLDVVEEQVALLTRADDAVLLVANHRTSVRHRHVHRV